MPELTVTGFNVLKSEEGVKALWTIALNSFLGSMQVEDGESSLVLLIGNHSWYFSIPCLRALPWLTSPLSVSSLMPQWVGTPAGDSSAQCIPPSPGAGCLPVGAGLGTHSWNGEQGSYPQAPARCVPSLIILQRMREKLDEQFSDNMPLCENSARLFKISQMK